MRGRLSHARASCVSRCASGNASSPARPGPLMCCSCSSDNTQQGHGRWSTDVVNSFRIWTGSPSCSCARDNFRPTTNTLLVYEGCLHGINSRSRLQVLSKKKSAQLYTCNEGASMEDTLSSCSSYSLGRIRLDLLPSSGMALFSLLRRLRSSSGRGEGRGLCSRASMYRYRRYIVPSAPDMIAPAPGAWAVSPSRGISHGARRYQSYQTRASFYLLALARRLVGDRLRLRASDLPECQATATGVQSGPSPLLELKRVSALRN